MKGPLWPPTGALWGLAAVCLGGATALLVAGERAEWVAVLVAVALGTAALAVDRQVDGPGGPGAADRRRLPPTETEVAREVVDRRPVLHRAVLAVGALAGTAAVGWLWRFAPRRDLRTGWADGVRCVDADGRPVRADDLALGGIVTVWPAHARHQELGATVVLRIADRDDGPSSEDDTLRAYSRICTHAGCPVALFRAEDSTLYCPCHQATFDARNDARPVFGPASRPLPRLPVGIDDDGFLVARGDFDAPPGPEAGGRP